MYIQELEIDKYSFFKVANIKSLKWNNVAPISIIAGKNGAGKSSLLRACLPLPLVRTMFEKKGSFSETIVHRNDVYKISSDFSNNTSPHSFVMNDTELNISGTTRVQQELVERYLGLTPTICKLLTIETKLTSMTPTQRKTLLSELNPSNMALALEKYKFVKAQLKSCNSNLVLLHERKSHITDQLIKPEVRRETEHHLSVLTTKKEVLVSWVYTLQAHINTINTENTSSIQSLEKLQRDIDEINRRSHLYRTVSREAYKDELTILKSNKAVLQDRIVQTEQKIDDIVKKIDKYKSYLKEGDTNNVRYEIEQKAKELEKYISTIHVDLSTFQPIHNTDIDSVKYRLESIHELLMRLVDISIDIPTTDDITTLKGKIEQLKQSSSYITKQINDNDEQCKEINNKLNQHHMNVPDNCQRNACDLFKRYSTFTEDNQKKLSDLIEKNTSLEKEYKTQCEMIDSLTEQYTDKYAAYKSYQAIIDIFVKELPFLSSFIHKYDVQQIGRRPLKVYKDLIVYIDESVKYHKKAQAVQELSSLQKQIIDIKKDKRPSIEFINKLVDENESAYEEAKNVYEDLKKQSVTIDRKMALWSRYDIDTTTLSEYTIELDKDIEYRESIEAKKYYVNLLGAIQKIIIDVDNKLSKINKVLNEQNDLQSRLNNEILQLIKDTEERKVEYEALEVALSPTSGFPNKYMVSFINNIIDNMNVFLSKIFTYPLIIHPLSYNDNLTYNFRILVGDIRISDVSSCSEGQRSMIDFAFCLASVTQLKLNDYPLFLDEISKSLDPIHEQELLQLLKYLFDNQLISQLLIVSHTDITSGLSADIVEINSKNNNPNVKITTY